jgi:hypothetical protein
MNGVNTFVLHGIVDHMLVPGTMVYCHDEWLLVIAVNKKTVDIMRTSSLSLGQGIYKVTYTEYMDDLPWGLWTHCCTPCEER